MAASIDPWLSDCQDEEDEEDEEDGAEAQPESWLQILNPGIMFCQTAKHPGWSLKATMALKERINMSDWLCTEEVVGPLERVNATAISMCLRLESYLSLLRFLRLGLKRIGLPLLSFSHPPKRVRNKTSLSQI